MSVSEIDLHFGPWTESDYFALPEDHRRIELLDGSLLVSPDPTVPHQRVGARLWGALDRLCPSGLEVLPPVNVRLASGRILIPDLAVVTRLGIEGLTVEAADVALALEIVSPGSVAADRAIKPVLYAQAGIPIYVRIELAGGPVAIVGHLVGDRYVISAPNQILRLDDPFRAEIDLPALLAPERR